MGSEEINDRFDRLETLAAVAAVAVKEEAHQAALHLEERTLEAAQHLEARIAAEIHRQDERLEALQKAVGEVNKSVNGLLSSVLVLQRNSMRVLGAGALLSGVLISILSRALGL